MHSILMNFVFNSGTMEQHIFSFLNIDSQFVGFLISSIVNSRSDAFEKSLMYNINRRGRPSMDP